MTSFIIRILITFLFQQPSYPLKNGKPTSEGIQQYVIQNKDIHINEFQKIVKDTLYDVYVYADDLSKYPDYNPNDLGVFYIPNEIIITSETKYHAYEVKMLTKFQRKTIVSANNFVKGTIFHELMHYYFNQVVLEMKMLHIPISSDYDNFSMLPRINSKFGEGFIEEGFCEYMSISIGENIITEDYYQPKSEEEILNNKNKVYYQFAPYYLKSFINYFGFKKAIQMIVAVKPPSVNEMIYPVKFFNRVYENKLSLQDSI